MFARGLKGEKRRVDIVFLSDRRIKKLSGRFRKSFHSTDVLAFSYDDPNLAGDVAVSVDTAKRQARERRIGTAAELALLCVHGLLHISGEGDEDFAGWCKMRRKEFEAMMKIL